MAMEVEDVLASRLRIRIMKLLIQMSELNVSEIARRLGANYKTTSNHLELLGKEGILLHKQFGRIRLYRINEYSAKTKAIQTLFEVWKTDRVEK